MPRKTSNNLVQLEEVRKSRQDEDRRSYQRVLFNNVLNAYTVIEEKGLLEVKLLDISESGIRFGMTPEYGKFKKNEKLAFRLYFSQNDYLPITIKVVRRQLVQSATESDFVEYGCKMLGVESEIRACIGDLVHFIKRYTAVAKNDHGDRQVFFL
jgi:hypothetical protein